MNCELVVKNIRKELEDYLRKYNLRSVIEGVSGGIDSALSCALAYPICKKLSIPLIGVSIPIETNKQNEIDRATEIGNTFCDRFFEFDLTEEFINERDNFWLKFGSSFFISNEKAKIVNGNLKARTRMKVLYFLANMSDGIVLSNDNYTEYCLGFFTIFGDVGDVGMIQNIWKTEVYEIASYLVNNELKNLKQKKVLQDCIDAVPTDGLGISNSDLDQFGVATYSEVDKLLQTWLTCTDEEMKKIENNSVILRHEKTHFKRNHPYNFSRKQLGLQ